MANNSLSLPSYPQAVNGKIDINAQKSQGTVYIVMLIPYYFTETKGDKIVGYLKDSITGNIITSIPKILNENPDKFVEILFSIDDFSEDRTYHGYYIVTKSLSGNEAKSDISDVTMIFYGESEPKVHQVVTVPQATSENGTLLTKDDYYRLDELEIIVPVYDGMTLGQNVQVLWQGQKGSFLPQYSTNIQEVTEINPLTFYIPRMQFLDSIGSTARIWFKINNTDGNYTSVQYSEFFFLTIEKQRLNLPAPKLFYRGDGTIHVIIKYEGMAPPDSVEIRAVGKSQTQSNYKPVDDPQQMGVKLPEDWVNENRGSIVLIDYAVGSMNPGVRYDFSRILRRVL
ncbi:hypothetical protein PSI15_16330 [Xenorhabdus sp. PR6a]|uniref:hypothetical protein n=1 Tax=Xenorhabdus sp. PR6a TaxID=3025877 RepID=UPI0023599F7D|nr:hypothetical protein [Xenorhabdus sp. PR6a]MDC9583109.1 hypothetical protein [Xenorhabdus sp. PR6a]